jgi:mono/diheme cytochrome c family protein
MRVNIASYGSAVKRLTRMRAGLAAAAALLAALPIESSAQWAPFVQTAPPATPGSPSRGERLFTGATHFRSRGPACISCHSIAGLPFPNGGTLGPDLTRAYKKLGPCGTQSAMQTLYFRVMTPIYNAHPLAPDEQADLIAFLEQSETKPKAQWNTQIVLLASLLLGGVLVALTGFLWRDRVKSVRQTLVDRATGQGARV